MKAMQYLKEIKRIDAKIDAKLEELERLNALITKTTVAMGGERVQTSGSPTKMENAVTKAVDLKDEINAEIDRLIDYKAEAIALIDSVCDAECIRLLHSRYLQYKTWETMAVEMGYTYQWVSGGLHQRALSQLQKALDERSRNDGETEKSST